MKRIARFLWSGGRRVAEVSSVGPVRVVVFDFDGTLADTFQTSWEILNSMAKDFKYRPLLAEEIDGARDLSTRGMIRLLGIPKRKLPAISRQGVRLLKECIHEIEPLPGIPEMLKNLNDRGLRMGVVTSNSVENVQAFAENHDLEVFEFVRSSSRLGGKAREIRKVMRRLGFRAADALYVGDETRDIEACRSAGIRCAAVTWGYNSQKALEAQRPHWMLERPEELVGLIETLEAKAE
ncbi:MAG: HAD-IA family hydrolase [Chthoniobacterales bacterium]